MPAVAEGVDQAEAELRRPCATTGSPRRGARRPRSSCSGRGRGRRPGCSGRSGFAALRARDLRRSRGTSGRRSRSRPAPSLWVRRREAQQVDAGRRRGAALGDVAGRRRSCRAPRRRPRRRPSGPGAPVAGAGGARGPRPAASGGTAARATDPRAHRELLQGGRPPGSLGVCRASRPRAGGGDREAPQARERGGDLVAARAGEVARVARGLLGERVEDVEAALVEERVEGVEDLGKRRVAVDEAAPRELEREADRARLARVERAGRGAPSSIRSTPNSRSSRPRAAILHLAPAARRVEAPGHGDARRGEREGRRALGRAARRVRARDLPRRARRVEGLRSRASRSPCRRRRGSRRSRPSRAPSRRRRPAQSSRTRSTKGVIGSCSFATSACMRASRSMKFVAEVSSSRRRRREPASSASTRFAAWLVLPLASSVQKASGRAPPGSAPEEGRDVDLLDAAAVLGAELHGVGARRDALAAVARHVGVDAALERAQQRRLPVVAAADDERHALRDAEPRDASARAPPRGGSASSTRSASGARSATARSASGQVARAARAREDRAVGEERDEAARRGAGRAGAPGPRRSRRSPPASPAGSDDARSAARASWRSSPPRRNAASQPEHAPLVGGERDREPRLDEVRPHGDGACARAPPGRRRRSAPARSCPRRAPRGCARELARARARARKSSSAMRRVRPSKSAGGNAASSIGTRSRTREGGAKGSGCTWSTWSSIAAEPEAPAQILVGAGSRARRSARGAPAARSRPACRRRVADRRQPQVALSRRASPGRSGGGRPPSRARGRARRGPRGGARRRRAARSGRRRRPRRAGGGAKVGS